LGAAFLAGAFFLAVVVFFVATEPSTLSESAIVL
jgi:hypothetical protein